MADETLTLRGKLTGHANWVTAIATTPQDPDVLVSSSRDKSILIWTVSGRDENAVKQTFHFSAVLVVFNHLFRY